MKTFYSVLALLLFSSVAQAQTACIEMVQPAVNPDGVCEEFATPCDVPEDWKSIPSCDLVDDNQPTLSLEQKMNLRFNKFSSGLRAKNAAKNHKKDLRSNAKSHRQATGIYTRDINRSRRLGSRAGVRSDRAERTFTSKNYSRLETRRHYAKKAGYSDTKTHHRQSAYQRPAQISSTFSKRSGQLKDTIGWNTLSRQHMRKKSYGRNPFNVKSQYAEDQKKARDKTNQKVDVEARKLSGYRTWRGARNKEANIDQELTDQ